MEAVAGLAAAGTVTDAAAAVTALLHCAGVWLERRRASVAGYFRAMMQKYRSRCHPNWGYLDDESCS